jgi:hypothetical protein
MKKQFKKFLEFNGKNIYFLTINGIYWIAVKPICESLNIDDIKQRKILNELQNEVEKMYNELYLRGSIQTHEGKPNFTKVISEQTMFTENGKLRKMLCINEEYVYGWIFQIQSPNNDQLLIYKLKCYQLLYNYFHGAITNRENLLKAKTQAQIKIELLEKELKDNPTYKKLQELKKNQRKSKYGLLKLDTEIINSQMEIWTQDLQAKYPVTNN